MSDTTKKATQKIREQSLEAQMRIAAYIAEGGSLDDGNVRDLIITHMFNVAEAVVIYVSADFREMAGEGIRVGIQQAMDELPAPGDA